MTIIAENQTISKRLLGISKLSMTTSAVVIAVLMLGFGTLFVVRGQHQRASDILLYLEKSAGNMGQVSVTIQSYLLDPEENGVWDEKDLYQTSALSFLNLAEVEAHDQEMIDSINTLESLIEDTLTPIETEFAKLITENPAKAKELYATKYVPAIRTFDAKINLARSKASEISNKYLQRINLTMTSIAVLAFLLLVGNGLIMRKISGDVAGSATSLLSGVCTGLVKNAKTVQSASHQVESSSTTLAQAAGEQASSQQETASSIEEILRILTRNSQHAAANLEVCQKGQQETVHGKQVVNDFKTAMEDMQNLKSRLENLIKIISDIDAKTNIINDIAFQTKILSFNASVEAARSGEHGKGFAVVAEEVGKLSALSKDAAEEIKQLISTSGVAVTEVVRMTQEKIDSTKEISSLISDLFDSFYRVMGQIMAATEQMMTAAMEQQSGMEQIRTTMTEVGHATEVTSLNSEKLATYAKGLANESEGMRNSVNQLSLLIHDDVNSAGELDFESSNQPTQQVN